MDEISRVYILTDSQDRIVRIEGEYTLPSDLAGWIKIDEGEACDRLNLAQCCYLDKAIIDSRGIYQYKYVGGEIIERTQAEKDADYNAVTNEPTQLDRIEAQAYYTALMTDTLLEG